MMGKQLAYKFSDYIPYPKNPLGNRMQMEEFENYLNAVEKCRKMVESKMTIYVGFDSEYINEQFRTA